MAKSASSNLTLSIPNLMGGVSQQAPAVRSVNQCEAMENAIPSPVEGLIKRHPTQKVSEIRNASATLFSSITESTGKPHLIVRDSGEKYFVFIRPNASSGNCFIEVYDLNGTKKTVHYDTGAQDYLVNATRSSLKMLTVADVTFVVNTDKVVTMDAAKTTAIDYNKIALVYIKQSASNRKVTITVSDTNGSHVVTASHTNGANNTGTDHAAEDLAGTLNGAGPAGSTYTANSSDSVIKITRATDFLITVDDDFGGQGAYLIRESVQRFEDLPQAAPHNHVVKVVGVPESGLDDYFVKFETVDGSGFTKGIWRETIAPDIQYQFNYSTMPHILIRQANGTFMFKKADGGTPASPNGPGGTAYAGYEWADRLVGDEATNSNPSFVGMKISNLVLFKNRLGFLSDENIILSETSEFFNFWRTTVLEIPDSDSIDISSSSPKIGKLKSGTVFNAELILFTDSSQLVLRGGEILSAKSVALLPVGDYENYSDIQPISSGLSVFFPYNRGGNFAGIREMIPQPNIDGSYIVNTVTELVPSYIAGKPVHITASAQEDMVAVVSSGDIYLYKYLRSSEGMLQSAWFKYNFPDDSTAGYAKAIWAEFVDTDLYVLVLRSNSANPVLEKIRLGVKLTDSDTVASSNWVCHLDARSYNAAASGSYNATTGLTTWNLPKPYSYVAGKTAVYTTNGASLTVMSGSSYNQGSDAAGTVSVRGDYSAVAVWIGYRYTMKYEFSQLWLPAAAGNGRSALQTGRYQLKNMNLMYEATSFFKVQVVSGDENTYTYDYSGIVIASSVLNQIYLNRGTYRFPIYGRNSSTKITVLNDTALPCKLLSAEVEGDYIDRAMRYA